MNNKNKGSLRNLRAILYDIFASVLVYLICHLIFTVILRQPDISVINTFGASMVYLAIYLLVGLSDRHYDLSSFFYLDRLVKRVLIGWGTSTAFVLLVFFVTGRAQTNKAFYITYFIMSFCAHTIAALLSYRMSRKKEGAKKTLFVGTVEEFAKFNRYMKKTSLPLDAVGYVRFNGDSMAEGDEHNYLGYVDRGDLERIIKEMVIDQVYIMSTLGLADVVRNSTDACVTLGIETHLVMPLDRDDCSVHISSIGTYPVTSYHLNSINPGMNFVKRAIDIVGALVGIILSAPIALVAAIAIKLDSEGPVFFSQTRVGRNGRRFKILKLRTMTADAEVRKQELLAFNEMGGGIMFKIKEDPRVTKVGAFLRKTSIDELPQFLNVLMGDMSLVGTRPPTEDEVGKYSCEHWRRLRIKPGITGLWQISGRNVVSDFDDIVELDTKYIENWTILTDFRIILSTVGVVLKRKGAY